MNDTYYPPGAFHFTVNILGTGALSLLTSIDASFQEVSGIQAELGVEEVTEGGENRFVHRLPRPAKYSNLVLKRGIVTTASLLAEWVDLTVGSSLSLPILPQNLLVTLLNDSGDPLVAWVFVNAYPLKCNVAAMSSMENKILVETMELSYNYFVRITVGSALSFAAKVTQLVAGM
jgi:phage tail-like protein